ncbi:MAG: thiaminase II, partial [Cyanophyceae cyanobacterium]
MTFTSNLWQTIRPIYQAILEHPFSQDLMQGSLDPLCFQFYLQQDAL